MSKIRCSVGSWHRARSNMTRLWRWRSRRSPTMLLPCMRRVLFISATRPRRRARLPPRRGGGPAVGKSRSPPGFSAYRRSSTRIFWRSEPPAFSSRTSVPPPPARGTVMTSLQAVLPSRPRWEPVCMTSSSSMPRRKPHRSAMPWPHSVADGGCVVSPVSDSRVHALHHFEEVNSLFE